MEIIIIIILNIYYAIKYYQRIWFVKLKWIFILGIQHKNIVRKVSSRFVYYV